MVLTIEDLKEMLPEASESNLNLFIEWLNHFMSIYKIDDENEVAKSGTFKLYIVQVSTSMREFIVIIEPINLLEDSGLSEDRLCFINSIKPTMNHFILFILCYLFYINTRESKVFIRIGYELK